MDIIVRERGQRWPDAESFPTLYLTNDLWDDYGFKTMFQASLVANDQAAPTALGDVKIIYAGQTHGRTELPAERFDSLPGNYCSLGQEFSYYESLNRHGAKIRDTVLMALRDVTRFPAIEEAFQDEEAFRVSLFREGSARRALEDARALFAQRSTALTMELAFDTSVGGENFTASFPFGDSNDIPSRVVAIIGYNGSGKTRLLANIGMVAQADATQRSGLVEEFGRFVGMDPQFSAVVTVSYSAFDTFTLPDGQHGHVYCGLRKPESDSTDEEGPTWALKSIRDIVDEFLAAMEKALERDRVETYRAAVAPLGLEPSFNEVEIDAFMDLPLDEAGDRFQTLSTGHKIVLNIITQLVAHLQPNGLVLIDEPESHLHPPLLAAMLRAIWIVLDRYNSFGIIATHSPVVLQEIPQRYVRLLQRFGRTTYISPPAIQTYGESIGLLTSHVFRLDASATDHQGVLRRLAGRYTIDEINGLFGGELSSQARAYLMSIRSSQ